MIAVAMVGIIADLKGIDDETASDAVYELMLISNPTLENEGFSVSFASPIGDFPATIQIDLARIFSTLPSADTVPSSADSLSFLESAEGEIPVSESELPVSGSPAAIAAMFAGAGVVGYAVFQRSRKA